MKLLSTIILSICIITFFWMGYLAYEAEKELPETQAKILVQYMHNTITDTIVIINTCQSINVKYNDYGGMSLYINEDDEPIARDIRYAECFDFIKLEK